MSVVSACLIARKRGQSKQAHKEEAREEIRRAKAAGLLVSVHEVRQGRRVKAFILATKEATEGQITGLVKVFRLSLGKAALPEGFLRACLS